MADPALVTLAYPKVGEQWLLVAHHSSLRPVPPKP